MSQTVKTILVEFLSNTKIKEEPFLSEAQFQHELAKHFEEKGYDSYLEIALSVNEGKKFEQKQKYQVDLILKKDKKIYIIELKYKTASKEIRDYKDLLRNAKLKNQAAQNHASEAFVRDIYRIEKIKNQFAELFINDGSIYGGGYAVFLTNARTYVRDMNKTKQNGEGTDYENFALTRLSLNNTKIDNKANLSCTYKLFWNEVGKEYNENEGLDLTKYSSENFYYLVVEII